MSMFPQASRLRTSRSRRGNLAARLLLVGVVAALAGRAGVPLYDGVGFPDEPYRYVGGTPAPSDARTVVVLQGGRSLPGYLATREVGPQFSVDLPAGSVSGPAGQVTVTGTPVRPDGAPPHGSWNSNAYRVDLSPAATVGGSASVILRSAVMTKPSPVVVQRTGGAWTELPTRLVGTDILQGPFTGPGEYALERPAGATPLSGGGGSPLDTVVWSLIGVGFVALVGSAGVSIARERRRKRASPAS